MVKTCLSLRDEREWTSNEVVTLVAPSFALRYVWGVQLLVAAWNNDSSTQQPHDPNLLVSDSRKTMRQKRRSYFDYCRGEECSRKPIIAQLLRLLMDMASSWCSNSNVLHAQVFYKEHGFSFKAYSSIVHFCWQFLTKIKKKNVLLPLRIDVRENRKVVTWKFMKRCEIQ